MTLILLHLKMNNVDVEVREASRRYKGSIFLNSGAESLGFR